MKFSVITVSALAALISTGALAEDKRAADAHQHGHGVLNVALEGQSLGIELETPGADILGFEHVAEAEEDKAIVQNARMTLSDPVTLFGLPAAAGCSVSEAEIEIGAEEMDHADGHDEEHAHEDEHDDHKEEHADSHGHGHEHDDDHDEHDDHAEEGDTHSEVHAHYTLTCTAPAKITGLDLSAFFAAFPNAEELDAALLTDNGQAGGEITPVSPRLTF